MKAASIPRAWRLDGLPLCWGFSGSQQVMAAVLLRLPGLHPADGDPVDRWYRTEEWGPVHAAPGLAVRCGRRAPVVVAGVEQAADAIVNDLQRFLAHRAPGLVLIHAGAVGWRGRALVLPGRSCSGKSRLVAALLEAGASYLSDELAVVDALGHVRPYARPLALRRDGGGVDRVAAAAFGAAVELAALPIGGIAFLRHRAGAPWAPHALSPGEAFLNLLRHTVAARRRFELVRGVLLPLALEVPAIAGHRDEAAAVAVRLLEWSAPRAEGRKPRPGFASDTET